MKSIAITVDDELAEQIAEYEAGDGNDLSALVSEFLRARLQTRRTDTPEYQEAMRRFLSFKPRNLSDGQPYPTREEIHDRRVLR